jgi:hypothetical protein
MSDLDLMERLASKYGDAFVLLAVTGASGGGRQFEFVRALSAAEAERYHRAHASIGQKALAFELVELLNGNLLAAEAAVHAVRTSLPGASHDVKVANSRAANRSIINYLTSVRLYLDHTNARLQRTYGAGSKPSEAFTYATRTSYDTSSVYPFVYKLRNYVQHCGMPLQIMRRSERIVPDGDGGERVECETFVGCDCDKLLTGYDSWGTHAKAFIKAQTDEFELLPVLKQFAGVLDEVQKAVWVAETRELWPDMLFVTRLCAEVCDGSRRAEVVQIQKRPGVEALTLHLYTPPFGTLHQLDLLREHPTAHGWIVKPGPHLVEDVELVLRE